MILMLFCITEPFGVVIDTYGGFKFGYRLKSQFISAIIYVTFLYYL